ncbi:glycosyltransferase [Nostoc mirabile]|uniref:glycosyltransferase n=1 Tax=Nostoc mirabile TaxID=2907820 RepID=UPI002278709F|nr:glycosyltransferase [Nostoc mirabile]
MSQVSIIIPTLNEATNLGRTLRQLTLLNPPPSEVIVVDGGSQDQTVTVAKRIFESFNQTLNVPNPPSATPMAIKATNAIATPIHIIKYCYRKMFFRSIYEFF